ncbi:MAG: carboxypeptidase regulatory-like domain-containing protein [Phycisphaerae bacterium]|nr:carboxypeptidase regulatory-like domain-containing protein [Gemmatimonadaceae bacterium]
MAIRGTRILILAMSVACVCSARTSLAQQTDVIRGRVTSDDGKAVAELAVTATSIPNNVTRSATTDRNGRYTITFANGDGDYWMAFAKIGFAAKRFELKRIADEVVMVADARVDRNGELLDEIRVRADRARGARNASSADPLGTEKTVTGAGVDPSQSGSLAALAASSPGVQLIPGADGNPDQFSVFGLSGDQNRATLNGVGFSGADVPRDASARTSLGVTPWDVSRGGFSGAQLSLRTQSGSNLSTRGISSLLNAPQLEWTDRSGRALGAEYSSMSLGAATAGPMQLDKSFYSAGYQFDRRNSNLPTLGTASVEALTLAGVAADSVTSLKGILGRTGVPLSVPGTPSSRTNERGMFLAAFDLAPPTSNSGQALNVTAAGSLNRVSAPFAQVTGLSTNDVRSINLFGALQARHTNYVRGSVLAETMLGVSQSRMSTEPYLQLPAGMVRVASALDDGSSGITGLSFGGSRVQRTRNTSTTVTAENQLSWFSLNNKHGIKLTSSARYENFARDLTANELGTFTYNSLVDLNTDKPFVFTRLLAPRRSTSRQLIAGVSLGDTYKPRADLQLQYGVRVDGNRFLSRPELNGVLLSALNANNARVPNRLYVSPRVGFSWTYGEAAQLAVANGFVRGPRAVVRGGVGVFQNLPSADIAGSALANTGLPDAIQQLMCVGDAAPTPQWRGYANGTTAIPDKCADGSSGTVFASTVPDVALFENGFQAQRSIRGSLNWTGAVLGGRLTALLDATSSRNRNQSGVFDLNFKPDVRFIVVDEGARAVYVSPNSIVEATGAIASLDGRRSQQFAQVSEMRSDLYSSSSQYMFGVRPVAFSSRYSWSAGYVYSNARDVVSGFASTVNDPRQTERGRSALDSRHQFTYAVSYSFLDWVPVSLTGSLRSGRPFTPMVSNDVNGDGYVNDRAFVFDAASADATVRAGMASLMENGSARARSCLASQTGRLAARNSCQGPWTNTSSLTLGVNPVKFRLPQRLNVSVFVNNAFGAADLLLNGENRLKGWGQSVVPEQTLLFVRSFDSANRKFRYEVNPRFGATSQSQTLTRNPVVVTAQFRVDVGYARERQLLTQSLDKGRVRPGTLPTDVELRGMGGTLIPPNPITLILQQADSLKLTRMQADSLATLNRSYSVAFEETWMPLAQQLAALPVKYDRSAAYQRYRLARESSIDVLMKLAPDIRGLLTRAQLRRLPTQALTSLDTRYLASVRSSTAGGANMGALAMLAQMGWAGGTVDASATAVMLHR